MTEFTVTVRDQNGKGVKGAKVTVNGDFPQMTDELGQTHYNINQWNIQLKILATKGLSKSEGTISVDIFAVAHPGVLVLTMFFDVSTPLSQPLAGAQEAFARNAWLLTLTIIAIIIVFGVVLISGLFGSVKGAVSSVGEKVSDVGSKVKEKVKGK